MADFGITEYIAIAGVAASVAGTAASVAAAQQQAEAQAGSLRYQAQVAKNNQSIAEGLATRATQAGESQVSQKRAQTAAVIGGQLAGQAAGGLDVNKGSAVDVRSSAAELGELDALTIRSNAENTAFGYKTQGLNFGAQAAVNEATAQNALTAGNLNAFTSLAGGASSISDKWLKYQHAGLLS
jgi:hypothetical protein